LVKNNQIISDDERKAIKELSELIDELNVTEIEIQNEKVGKVRVSKNKTIPNQSNNTATTKTSAPKDKEENLAIEDTIKSPMVGTVYLQPEPGSDSFVKVGDKVKKGQTILIIEAMKTMNDIIAEKDGTVKDILVKNEQPVQFDDPLMIIE
tara:strand:- start:662 stop:1114 length:453 start_codon:yes stop_codon:yes gene_type:complete